MPITPKTTIAEIVYQYPELIEPLHEIGLYCFSWGGSPAWGTLALQARLLGIKNLDEIVEQLNAILAAKEKRNAPVTNATTEEPTTM